MEKVTKKLLFLMTLLFVGLGFSACSSDDDPISKNNIVGTWEYTQSEDGDLYKETLQFNSNGTGSETTTVVSNSESYTRKQDFHYTATDTANGEIYVVMMYDDTNTGVTFTCTQTGRTLVRRIDSTTVQVYQKK